MQGYTCKKYTNIQAQGYMSTKLQNDVRIQTVTFQNMLHSQPSGAHTKSSKPSYSKLKPITLMLTKSHNVQLK